jgi:hypothetical protein
MGPLNPTVKEENQERFFWRVEVLGAREGREQAESTVHLFHLWVLSPHCHKIPRDDRFLSRMLTKEYGP